MYRLPYLHKQDPERKWGTHRLHLPSPSVASHKANDLDLSQNKTPRTGSIITWKTEGPSSKCSAVMAMWWFRVTSSFLLQVFVLQHLWYQLHHTGLRLCGHTSSLLSLHGLLLFLSSPGYPRTHYIVLASLKLTEIQLPLPSESWDSRPVSLCPASSFQRRTLVLGFRAILT